MRSTRSGKKPIYINLQHYDKTTYLLENAGISIRDAWKEDPERLAEILEVDAVVKARIEKQRFMSDLASFGIDLGIEIMNVLTNNTLFPWLPFGATRSKEIRADFLKIMVTRFGLSVSIRVQIGTALPTRLLIISHTGLPETFHIGYDCTNSAFSIKFLIG
ncbi:MAG: hypothetical protein GY705_06790 [Bacteroidetes bacterium]|nr:hypothetical protein [Bacteroidota bacterium]